MRSVGVPSTAATPLQRPGDPSGGAIDEFSLADSFVLGCASRVSFAAVCRFVCRRET